MRLHGRHFIKYIPDKKCRKCVVFGDGESYSGTCIRTYCSDFDVRLCIGDCDEQYHTEQWFSTCGTRELFKWYGSSFLIPIKSNSRIK